MNFKEIQELIKQINRTNIAEFKIKQQDFEISIRTDKLTKNNKTTEVVHAAPQLIAPSMPQFPQATPPPAAPTPAPAAESKPTVKEEAPAKDDSNYIEIKSPMVGTFYRSSSPDKPAFVKVGDKVDVGSVVCIVEAMKLFNEIESEVSGTIVKVLVEDAQPIEYDQVIYLVDPKG